jgi:uncharacterized membrane protein YciS (DUF1049 family)
MILAVEVIVAALLIGHAAVRLAHRELFHAGLDIAVIVWALIFSRFMVRREIALRRLKRAGSVPTP